MPECKDRNSIYFTICLRFCKNIILLRRFFPFFLNFIKKIYPFLYLVKIRFRVRNIWRVNASKEEPFIFRAKKLQCEFPLEKSSARLFLSREDFPLFFFFFCVSHDFTPLRSGFFPRSSGKYDWIQSTRRPLWNFSTTISRKEKSKKSWSVQRINKPIIFEKKER